MANGRCRLHGGKTPCGPALPQFKSGRYSKLLPAGLADRYAAALSDPDLLSMHDELALLDAHLADTLAQLERDGSPVNWERLRAAWAGYKAAQKAGDYVASIRAFDTFEALMERGASQVRIWGEVRSLINQRRQLVESERRRLVELQQVITAESSMVLIAALLDSVTRNVRDRDARAAIAADFVRLTGGRSLPAPVPAGAG